MKPGFASRLRAGVAVAAIAAQLVFLAQPALAFCGFYVAKADSKLFNKSSKVVLARDGDTTAITMASDYEGEPKEFAVVVPVPTFIARDQISVVAMKTIDHLDAFTSPRLVEYHDEDPCAMIAYRYNRMAVAERGAPPMPAAAAPERYRGVTIEATYAVGEYDVSILSAKESDGLVNWLTDNEYRIPAGAEAVLGSYIKQGMRFFVAKVNIERMQILGQVFLRPLQVRYDSAKFMLPLRLGTVNASGPQDLIIFALTRKGRVETTNYRTVKLPTGVDVPLYVKDDFGKFYKAMFERAVSQEDMRAVFLEYAWDMGWCDPCAAEPMSANELAELGAQWTGGAGGGRTSAAPSGRPGMTLFPPPAGGTNAFVTRLHVRYDAAHFPEDLAFLETSDRENFQGRYVLRHPFLGKATCSAGVAYRKSLPARFREEAQNLAHLTGWSIEAIRSRMEATGQSDKL
jgi:hypothetical protein